MGYLKTTLKITAFVFSFAFLVIGMDSHTDAGRVGGFVMCAACAVVGLLFCIPTKADAERKRIRNERREANAAKIAKQQVGLGNVPNTRTFETPGEGAGNPRRNDHPLVTFTYALLAVPLAFMAAIFDLAKKS